MGTVVGTVMGIVVGTVVGTVMRNVTLSEQKTAQACLRENVHIVHSIADAALWADMHCTFSSEYCS